MKKLFLLSVAVLFVFTMSAQKIGVKVGYGMSGYLTNYWVPDGYKLANGFNAGLVGEYGLSDLLNLRLDIGYTQLGVDFYSDEDDMTIDMKTNVDYLNVGVSAKAGFGPAYVFVGPYFGYALSCKTNGEMTVGDETTVFDEEDNFADFEDGTENDMFNKVDFGLNLGVGTSFSGVFVEANVGMGLANFINTSSDLYSGPDTYPDNEDGDPISGDASSKNIFFGLSVGYLFGF
ncbi:MAG: PorT family protein [Bacteroidales bacterium]|nr:PorT family protein [Bacteroidales bacterium]